MHRLCTKPLCQLATSNYYYFYYYEECDWEWIRSVALAAARLDGRTIAAVVDGIAEPDDHDDSDSSGDDHDDENDSINNWDRECSLITISVFVITEWR